MQSITSQQQSQNDSASDSATQMGKSLDYLEELISDAEVHATLDLAMRYGRAQGRVSKKYAAKHKYNRTDKKTPLRSADYTITFDAHELEFLMTRNIGRDRLWKLYTYEDLARVDYKGMQQRGEAAKALVWKSMRGFQTRAALLTWLEEEVTRMGKRSTDAATESDYAELDCVE